MLTVHLTILVSTVLVILYTDHLGWRYLLGNLSTLNEVTMRRLHYAVGAGLIGMIVTGAWMAYPAFAALWALPLFKLKLSFVSLLVLNSFNLGLAINIAAQTPFKDLPFIQKARLLVGGGLSTLSWIGAIASAFILFG